MDKDLDRDVDHVRQIEAVPTILEVVCRTTGMGFAAVARVTKDRWLACEVLDKIDFGLKPGGELRVETTICNEIRDSREAVVIDNVAEDAVFCGHPTPAMYGFQSYISMPIVLPDDTFFGTLCAIDPRPARLKSPEIIGMFKLFAELIGLHIHARNKLVATERNLAGERHRLALTQRDLLDERQTSELREQFIAVLGHDLRNPLAALIGGVQLLRRRSQDDRAQQVLRMMADSGTRMTGLIDNVLDFARGRLGGGLSLQLECKPLEPTLTQVIDETRAAWPERTIETEFDLNHPFNGDHARLAQLLSNLLGNAVIHGADDKPIRIKAIQDANGLTLAVVNAGHPIPPDARTHLFKPFYRGQVRPNLQGLGLGLFIASQIADAHGGALDVQSDSEETRFTLTVPARAGSPA